MLGPGCCLVGPTRPALGYATGDTDIDDSDLDTIG